MRNRGENSQENRADPSPIDKEHNTILINKSALYDHLDRPLDFEDFPLGVVAKLRNRKETRIRS